MRDSPVSINHSLDNNHSRNNSYEDDDDCSCTDQDQHQLFSLENTRKGWYLSKQRQFYKMKQRLKEHNQPTDRCVKVCDWRCGHCRRSRTRFNTTGFDCLLYELRTEPTLTPITRDLAVPTKTKGNRVRFSCVHKGGVSLCFIKAITLLSEAHPPLHSNRAHRFYLQRLAVSHTLRC